MGKNYWMVVDSPEHFDIIRDHGFSVLPMGARYRRRAQRMQPDDHVLFYVTGLRKWTATAVIKSPYYEDHTPIFPPSDRGDDYPYRVKLASEIVLDEEDYIDALLLAPRLEYVKRWAPEDWPLAFLDTLHLIPQKDFRLIEGEMRRILSRKRRQDRRERRGERQQGSDQASILVETDDEEEQEDQSPTGDSSFTEST